ncbi:NAD(P)H-dependent oxidoreductase [Geomicrobium sp. JCM 19039]|uniref:NAD(P)H-dependent oxidoreductase n=1 Tax=Geomicrobium sp. JCM 19039 TaxID=1460636 RepID=UPI00045F2614|nr:NAD(P)H-dependent oxidoreductase [Geomicrobium sp. JCM 19039]GAK13057.1 FMN reductase [Geomicrobium sp. JCM 19039]
MTDVAIIYGGVKAESRLNVLTDYAIDHLESTQQSYSVIPVFELPSEDLITANSKRAEIANALKTVQEARAVIVLTPVFKSAYSGVLKTFLDLLPMKSLENKVVLPIMIGGSFGHLLAIDYSLKPVLTALGASWIQKGSYVLDAHVAEGRIIEQQAEARMHTELEHFINAMIVQQQTS